MLELLKFGVCKAGPEKLCVAESKTGAQGLGPEKFFSRNFNHFHIKSPFYSQFALGRRRFSVKLTVFEASPRALKLPIFYRESNFFSLEETRLFSIKLTIFRKLAKYMTSFSSNGSLKVFISIHSHQTVFIKVL